MDTYNKGKDFWKYVIGGMIFEISYFCLGYFGMVFTSDIAVVMMGIILLSVVAVAFLVIQRKHMEPEDSALKLGCGWLSAQITCVVAFIAADRLISAFGSDNAIADKDAIGTFMMVAFQEMLYVAAGIVIFAYLLKDIKKAESGLKKSFHILLMIVLLAFAAIPLYIIALEA